MLSLIVLTTASAIVFTVIISLAYWSIKKVPRWSFQSSVVLLTGGSAGIGLATAHELVSKKVLKLIIAARREDVLVCAVTQLREHAQRVNSPTDVQYVVMDVCDHDSVVSGVSAANELAKPHHINLLICNAGFAHPARFLESTFAHASAMMEVNYFGILRVLWAVLPSMITSNKNEHNLSSATTGRSKASCTGANRIVLVSSMAASAPIAGYSLYAASKSAVRALAHSLDMELSWDVCNPVHVQVVSPPDVATPGYDTENSIKCPECAAISSFAGSKPFSAESMGKAIVEGIENYKFSITLGSDGYLLDLASSRMEPASSVWQLLAQVLLGGPVRLGLAIFARFHYNIVRSVRTREVAKSCENTNAQHTKYE